MGAYVWPVDNWQAPDGSKYTGRRLRQVLGAMFTRSGDAARPLGARTAVLAGTPKSTLSASAGTWAVQPHRGVLDVEQQTVAGAYGYSIDDVRTGPIPAADQTQARFDLVAVQLSDPTEADGTAAPGVDIVYVPGTPGQGLPAAPARSLVLGSVNQPAVGGGAATVTWLAPFTAAAGAIVPCADATQYPANPYVGQHIDDALIGLLRWNGSAWVPSRGGRFVQLEVSATGESIGGTGAAQQVVRSWRTDYATSSVGVQLSNGTYTIQATGDYDLAACGSVSSISADTPRFGVAVAVNGAGVVAARSAINGGVGTLSSGPKRVHLNAGDVVSLTMFLSSGTGLVSAGDTWFSVRQVG